MVVYWGFRLVHQRDTRIKDLELSVDTLQTVRDSLEALASEQALRGDSLARESQSRRDTIQTLSVAVSVKEEALEKIRDSLLTAGDSLPPLAESYRNLYFESRDVQMKTLAELGRMSRAYASADSAYRAAQELNDLHESRIRELNEDIAKLKDAAECKISLLVTSVPCPSRGDMLAAGIAGGSITALADPLIGVSSAIVSLLALTAF